VSDILLQREHTMGLKKAKAAANRIAKDLESEFDCECSWDGNTLHFSRAGVNGHIVVAKDAVDLSVKLSFLLLAFKPKIEKSIQDNFHKYFG